MHEAKKNKQKTPQIYSDFKIMSGDLQKGSKAERKGEKSPYDQFLGATQRTADSHKTAI